MNYKPVPVSKKKKQALESELADPPPRRARFTAWTRLKRMSAWALWICIMVILFQIAHNDLATLQRLRATGKRMNATIYAKNIETGKYPKYDLEYTYAAGGTAYDGTAADVPKDEYDRPQIGSPLLITYLPSDPTTHYVGVGGEQRIDNSIMGWIAGIGLFSMIGACLVFEMESNLKKRVHLLRHGTIATGWVTGKNEVTTGKITGYIVGYKFKPDGYLMKKADAVPHTFYNSVQVGDRITILYISGNHKNSLPYRAISESEVA